MERHPETTVSEPATGDIEERIARLEQHEERATRALELLARHAEIPAVKAGRNWNAYAALIASFIGILALLVSGYTAYVQRQQLRAQVWPRLQLWMSDTNPGLYVSNQGTGPARITAVRVRVAGVKMRTWSDVKQATGFTGDELIESTISDTVLPAGKDYTIMQPKADEPSRAKFAELFHGKKRFSMIVCYCSVLEQCWTTSLFGEEKDDIGPQSDGCRISPDFIQ